MALYKSILTCPHCQEAVSWSKFFDDWYCADCRTHDVKEIEEEVQGLDPVE
jgi:hypothetical protein